MVDWTRLAEIKEEAATQLLKNLFIIRTQLLSSVDKNTIDAFIAVVSPKLAYSGCLPIKMPYPRCKKPVKLAIVCHDIGTAIKRYWELIRTDDTVGLEALLRKIKDYATHGFRQCEILGSEIDGYYLFNPAVQKAAESE